LIDGGQWLDADNQNHLELYIDKLMRQKIFFDTFLTF